MRYAIVIILITFFASISSYAQKKEKRKTLADFEKDFLDRVYIPLEKRLEKIPFQNSTSIKLYFCAPLNGYPKTVKSYRYSYDTLVNTHIPIAKDSILLHDNDIDVMSDIIINSKNAEYAYQHAEIAYKSYLEAIKKFGPNAKSDYDYAIGWTRDVSGNITIIQPTHLIVFYDDSGKISQYIGLDFKQKHVRYFTKDDFHIDGQNLLRNYIQRKFSLQID